MTKIDTIIFDLGGVLIDWNPEYVFLEAFNGNREKMQWFLDNVCTMSWNENQDAGYPITKATEDLVEKFPDYEQYIRMYYGDWENMLSGPIQGTVDILEYLLRLKSYKIVALTNWSAETFPIAQKHFDFLNWFEGIVVSGEEKTRKPYNDIFEITLKRFNIEAETSIFIDDNAKNIETANKLGINGIQFSTPKQLISDLKNYNITI
ncbi:HAD family hydrolase [Hyunsoonleella pacifica]|uniref:HAD family phosphatase n=1 Tax=Hyunsoonleella pacifica TaxID=1080224 RepID=A0A4Q9FRX3_9FLAO|nr:HAD family phosphatase [Hyunsoonleella pacifica]TBN17616.1 HAD family phosphatase [Hyunsoonleella pacifica]GGD10398.1 hydrolase [Hyunsoonleella pacifica]